MMRGGRRRALLLLAFFAAASAHAAATPDASAAPAGGSPANFGYKTSWFAVKADDPRAVAAALGLGDLQAAEWSAGVAGSYSPASGRAAEPQVFLSPPVDGWVLVASPLLPYPDHRAVRSAADVAIDARFNHILVTLALKFPDVQFFGSQRVVGFSAWARARNNAIERIFAYADGVVLANTGAQTPQERALGFLDLSGLSLDAAAEAIAAETTLRDRLEEDLASAGLGPAQIRQKLAERGRGPVPVEEDVLDVAGAWSVNPEQLDSRPLPPANAYLAPLPASLRQ